MEREALFIVMFREGSLLERFGSVLDRKASPKLLNAPLASLAALARLLRSPDRVELSMFFYCLFTAVLLSRWSTYKHSFELDFHANLAPC